MFQGENIFFFKKDTDETPLYKIVVKEHLFSLTYTNISMNFRQWAWRKDGFDEQEQDAEDMFRF